MNFEQIKYSAYYHQLKIVKCGVINEIKEVLDKLAHFENESDTDQSIDIIKSKLVSVGAINKEIKEAKSKFSQTFGGRYYS